jgi:hypothetical protein
MQRLISIVVLTLVLSQRSSATYSLQDDYSAASFLSMVDFFTVSSSHVAKTGYLTTLEGPDPTDGYVTYVSLADAETLGLVNLSNNQVYLGVDNSTISSGSGRSSVRISSTASYNHGLFILDLTHMPGGVCGTWPALYAALHQI